MASHKNWPSANRETRIVNEPVDWDSAVLLKRSISFDKSQAQYEEETRWGSTVKRCKLLQPSDVTVKRCKLLQPSDVKVRQYCKSDGKLTVNKCAGLDLIQLSYVDSDASSPTQSPTPSCSLSSVTVNRLDVCGNGINTSTPSIDEPSTSKSTMKPLNGNTKHNSNGTPIPSINAHTSNVVSCKQHNGILKSGVVNGKVPRKRVLSERGEAEAKYPVLDQATVLDSWRGSRLLCGSRNAAVGLFNYSNDCFINAVLQTVVHTAPLARYVAELHSCSDYSHGCFSCALGQHIRRALSSTSPFKAQWIQPYLNKIFPSHRTGYQEDAHELFTLMLDALDPPIINKGLVSSNQRTSTPMEQLFGGALRNEIKCSNCAHIYINYERIRELNLGLRMRKRDGAIGLNDLLNDYFRSETLTSFECKRCKRKTQALRGTQVLRAPNVLLVQLKRFNAFGCKLRLPVTVEFTLRLDRFMYKPDDSNIYSLCGLIEHQGDGLDRGHYISFVKGFDGNTWHCFDDESSRRVSVDEVRTRQGYVMVYTRNMTQHKQHFISQSSMLTNAMQRTPV